MCAFDESSTSWPAFVSPVVISSYAIRHAAGTGRPRSYPRNEAKYRFEKSVMTSSM